MKIINITEEKRNELIELGIEVVGDFKKYRLIKDGKEFRFGPDELESAIEKANELNEPIEEVEVIEEVETVEEVEVIEEVETVEEKPKGKGKVKVKKEKK